MECDLSVWEEAKCLLKRMQQVTRRIAERLEEKDFESLHPLLDERQEICERLDALRQRQGIASWVAAGSAEGLPESVLAASREIAGMFAMLLEEDERIRGKLEQARAALREDLVQLKMAKEAQRLYEGGALPLQGAFVDSKG